MIGKYKIITLCGSTRFKDEFLAAQKSLTLEGNIVISVGLFGHSCDEEVWEKDIKPMLDDMHLCKIDLADEIFVINPRGYIGKSTRREIDYAVESNKIIKYLEYLDITDSQNNPFALKSWINQGYPFTQHRQNKFEVLSGLKLEEIRENYCRNDGTYVAFVAIRWGFANLVNGRLIPTNKWISRNKFDNYGRRL